MSIHAPTEGRPRIALVLSGGGARGAYEAGVLAHVYEELPKRIGRPVHFDVVTGTSVGAIHACYLAGRQRDPAATSELAAIWRSLSLERVFTVGAREVFGIPRRLIGMGPRVVELPARGAIPERLAGLFDTSWLEEIVLEHIDWPAIRRNLDGGALHALAVAATEIGTGRSAIFVDDRTGRIPRWSRDPDVVAHAARIGPAHALASAAIPLAFPAVRIEHTYYSDGGLRLNTPLAPALRLGADRVLVISLRHTRAPQQMEAAAHRHEASYMSLTYLAGKALDALLLDRVEHDVDRLRLFNAVLERGVRRYGPSFLAEINEAVVEQRGAPYRIVDDCLIRPSRDLGEVAAECLAHQAPAGSVRQWLSRNVVRFLGAGMPGEADLLSYLMFDRCYAEHLIALGRADAAANEDALAAFFG